jgi:hypothetical protein
MSYYENMASMHPELSQVLRILQETPSEARGVGFEPFLHGLGVMRQY